MQCDKAIYGRLAALDIPKINYRQFQKLIMDNIKGIISVTSNQMTVPNIQASLRNSGEWLRNISNKIIIVLFPLCSAVLIKDNSHIRQISKQLYL